ncbi:hypothetical protein AXF42_Ash016064 [Apostasia shenzhenica]|uniref:Uncharacterized protein n=1 Tax=Apostasia shenzhenica TaxID=1088818 RepID=A0A2I0B3A6_9ASPA|nr:hypothetical protein AXF42_Ash016064 [Apostasia shenzhenica]
MDGNGGEASPSAFGSKVIYHEEIGDSEENGRSEGDDGDEVHDDREDDAESCVAGDDRSSDGEDSSGGGGGRGDERCISWRMWCLLGQEAAGWGCGDDVMRSLDSSPVAVDEAEKNRMFWEACLADESPLPPLF